MLRLKITGPIFSDKVAVFGPMGYDPRHSSSMLRFSVPYFPAVGW